MGGQEDTAMSFRDKVQLIIGHVQLANSTERDMMVVLYFPDRNDKICAAVVADPTTHTAEVLLSGPERTSPEAALEGLLEISMNLMGGIVKQIEKKSTSAEADKGALEALDAAARAKEQDMLQKRSQSNGAPHVQPKTRVESPYGPPFNTLCPSPSPFPPPTGPLPALPSEAVPLNSTEFMNMAYGTHSQWPLRVNGTETPAHLYQMLDAEAPKTLAANPTLLPAAGGLQPVAGGRQPASGGWAAGSGYVKPAIQGHDHFANIGYGQYTLPHRPAVLTQGNKVHYRLFVGNLAGEVTDAWLSKVFSNYSSLSKAEVVRNRSNKSMGFGYVSFSEADDRWKAFLEMQNKYICNQPIKVKPVDTDISVSEAHPQLEQDQNRPTNHELTWATTPSQSLKLHTVDPRGGITHHSGQEGKLDSANQHPEQDDYMLYMIYEASLESLKAFLGNTSLTTTHILKQTLARSIREKVRNITPEHTSSVMAALAGMGTFHLIGLVRDPQEFDVKVKDEAHRIQTRKQILMDTAKELLESGRLDSFALRKQQVAKKINAAADQEVARQQDEFFNKNYKPNVEFKDEHGRLMSQKEAFKYIPHGFHNNKGSDRSKRLKINANYVYGLTGDPVGKLPDAVTTDFDLAHTRFLTGSPRSKDLLSAFEQRTPVANTVPMAGNKGGVKFQIPDTVKTTETPAVSENVILNPTQKSEHKSLIARSLVSICVENLDLTVMEAMLYELFSSVSEVESIMVCRDTGNCPLGYAYVYYKSRADAQKALDELDGFSIKGKPCHIRWSSQLQEEDQAIAGWTDSTSTAPKVPHPKAQFTTISGTLVVNLHGPATEAEISNLFSSVGRVTNVSVGRCTGLGSRNRGYAHVTYECLEDAYKASKELGMSRINGYPITFKFGIPDPTLHATRNVQAKGNLQSRFSEAVADASAKVSRETPIYSCSPKGVDMPQKHSADADAKQKAFYANEALNEYPTPVFSKEEYEQGMARLESLRELAKIPVDSKPKVIKVDNAPLPHKASCKCADCEEFEREFDERFGEDAHR